MPRGYQDAFIRGAGIMYLGRRMGRHFMTSAVLHMADCEGELVNQLLRNWNRYLTIQAG